MQGFTIENEGLRTYLVYRPQPEEDIDMFGRKMLTANHIEGIIPVMPDMDGVKRIRYDITDMTSMETFLGEGIEKRRQLKIFDNALRFVLGAEQYLLDSSMFVMNIKYVYMDTDNDIVQLLYLPVVRAKPEPKINERIRNLFRNMVFAAKYPPGADNGYVAELINSLNNKTEFSPAEFFRILKKLDVPEESCDTQPPDTADSKDVLAEYDAAGDLHSGYVYSEISDDNDLYSDNPDNKKDSVFGHLKKLFFSKSDSKSSDEGTYTDYYINEAAPELKVAEDVKDIYRCPDKPEENEEPEKTAYMVRLSNFERVAINRKLFRIGKAASGSHYRITDNVAVSAAHAEISEENGYFYVSDLGSLNGTYVNGEKIGMDKPGRLMPGDVISFADEEFEFFCQ